MDRHMDNNLHCPDLIPFEVRSLFNEERRKGEQKRGTAKKGTKRSKNGKKENKRRKSSILDQHAHVASFCQWPARALIVRANCASTPTCASLYACCTHICAHLMTSTAIISHFDNCVWHVMISNSKQYVYLQCPQSPILIIFN